MNYIKHLTGFFDKVVNDENLNPTHISLYVALFQFLNLSRFQNPISICREEVMRVSKIYAKATYHKCMKDLHNLGYLKYTPSFNPFRGSLVSLYDLEAAAELVDQPVQKTERSRIKKQTCDEQVVNRQQTGTEQALVPSINNINLINNNKQIERAHSQENNFSPPVLFEVEEFFQDLKCSIVEAQRFFHHFESNGWMIGGHSPMKNWKSAARKWMLNDIKTSRLQPPAKLNHDKSYSEPL